MPRTATPPRERFDAKVDRSGGPDACHPWTAGTFKTTGYGVFHPSKGETTTAHRWLYIDANGDPGPDVHVDHECHNRDLDCPGGRDCPHRLCVNLTHLAGKTAQENGNAAPNAREHRTHCPRGHAYSPGNTRTRRTNVGKGWNRGCRQCERERDREVVACALCGETGSYANKARHRKICEANRARESE